MVVAAAASLAGGAAHAQDSPAEIEAEIDAAWRELEPLIEKHNATRIELAEKKDAAKELGKKIEPLQLKVDLARSEVVDIAVYTFKGGNVSTLNALLTTGSVTTFADKLARLDQFARNQQQRIAKVLEAKEEYEAEKAQLDALVQELSEIEDELASRTDEINAEIDRLEEMWADAGGSTGSTGGGEAGDCPSTYPGGAAGTAIEFACSQIGKPYGWGASGPDAYDCSGFTMAAWEQAGVSLPHNAASQRSVTSYIERSQLRPGDLVFYYSDLSHVGMYAGDGWIVHSSRAGVPVGMAPIDRSPIHSYGRPG
jgi:cell wall-associated NlpC family hydrolase